MHLRPAGKAGADIVAVVLLLTVKGQVLHQQRSRTYDAHLAPEDIPQLRQLVDAQRTQLLSEARQALPVRQQIAALVPRIAHAAELVELEDLLVLPRPLLTEDHRASQLDAHQNRRPEQQR